VAERVDLGFVLGLEPEQAVNYFKAKGWDFSFDWYDMWQADHTKAFTVAKAMQVEVLDDIREWVDKAIKDGITLQEFTKELTPRLQKRGWWGHEVVKHPSGGETVAELGSPTRLETIYRTNTQVAYNVGRYRDQVANVDDRPYWQYVAVMDQLTRPTHAQLNGKVFKATDPFWHTHYPPNGFNCFPAGTPVATPSGWRAIESIREGDLVLGGSGHAKPVQAAMRRHLEGEVVRVVCHDGSFTATENHRILTLRGWVSASRLQVGDRLVNIRQLPALDSVIGNVQDRAQGGGDLHVARPGDPAAEGHAFDSQAQPGQEKIHPVPADADIMADLEAESPQVRSQGSLASGGDGARIGMGQGIGGIEGAAGGAHATADVQTSRAGGFPQALGGPPDRRGVGLGLSLARGPAGLVQPLDGIAHPLRGGGAAAAGILPLGGNGFATVTNWDPEGAQESQDGMVSHLPAPAQGAGGLHPLDVEGMQGLADGAPLGRFDSLDGFRTWALAHCDLREVVYTTKKSFSSLVFNLEVAEDNSYCLPWAVVHNCRCRVRALTKEQVEAKGLEVYDGTDKLSQVDVEIAKNVRRPVTVFKGYGINMHPDPGWSYNPGRTNWQPTLPPHVPDVVKEYKKAIEGHGLAKETPAGDAKGLSDMLRAFEAKNPSFFNKPFKGVQVVTARDFADPADMYMMATDSRGMYYLTDHEFPEYDKWNPAKDLFKALDKVNRGKKLDFNEEYSVEALWHEMNHNRARGKVPLPKKDFNRVMMETVNQFVSRHTYPDFLLDLGGTEAMGSRVLKEGYGYYHMIRNFRAILKGAGLDENKVLESLQQINIYQRWDTMTAAVAEALARDFGDVRWKRQFRTALVYVPDDKVTDLPQKVRRILLED
jgi:SPP1 gp7 family putative phage head morphogenesis protein